MGARGGEAGAARVAKGGGGGGTGGMRLFSPEYYALCAGGGMLAAGATHLAITPLDVLKVNMQVCYYCRRAVWLWLPALLDCRGASSFFLCCNLAHSS